MYPIYIKRSYLFQVGSQDEPLCLPFGMPQNMVILGHTSGLRLVIDRPVQTYFTTMNVCNQTGCSSFKLLKKTPKFNDESAFFKSRIPTYMVSLRMWSSIVGYARKIPWKTRETRNQYPATCIFRLSIS